MDDLKNILIFIGLNSKVFLKNLLWFFLFFFIVIGLTIVMFFLNYRFIKSNLFIGFFILLLIFLNYYLKRTFYLKNQMIFNILFFEYLKNPSKNALSGESGKQYQDDYFSDNKKKFFARVSQILKESGSRFMTRKMFLALATLHLVNNKSLTLNRVLLNKIRFIMRKQVMIEISIIGLLALPFALISVLLSWGLWSGLKLLIFLLAFIFVYYIYTSIFEPTVFLIVQKKVYEMSSEV